MNDLGKVTRDLIFEEPFWGFFLITLNKEWRRDIPTAGVSKRDINFQLAINPDFWEVLSYEDKKGLLVHECLHISMHHIGMRELFEDWEIFNIAADISINQYIRKEWSDFINEFGCTIKTFEHLKLEKKQGTEYYYKKLKENMNDPVVQQALSCASGEDDEEDNPYGKSGVDHKTWEEFSGLDEATKKLMDKQTDYQLKEAAENCDRNYGKIPGELKKILKDLFINKKAKFDWKGYLRRFAGNSMELRKRKSRRKLSKRFPGNPGLKTLKRKHILVGVDTSGSVNDKELEDFFSEIHHIHKTGSKVTVAQCDSHIHDVSEYSPGKEIKISGRGGTSFNPVVEMFEKDSQYTCLIYLTDGYAPAPPAKALSRILWAHCSNSSINEALPGLKIKLN